MIANRIGATCRLVGKGAEWKGLRACISSDQSKVVPLRTNIQEKELTFEQPTHTGQAWDQEDLRNVRWTEVDKQVNPNIAMHLIAQVPAKQCKERVVSCDGGGGALGHPKIYINLDKPGNHACGYCGLRFYKEGLGDGPEQIQV